MTEPNMVRRGEFARVLPLHIPTVAFKGPQATDASTFRRAASNLDRGYDVGGSNTKAAVAELLRNAAAVLEANNRPDPPWSFHPQLQPEAGAR
jgi:hypothetical protein